MIAHSEDAIAHSENAVAHSEDHAGRNSDPMMDDEALVDDDMMAFESQHYWGDFELYDFDLGEP